MKYLKLVGLLIAVLGIILGVLMLSRDNESPTDIDIDVSDTYSKCLNEIEDNWKKANKWDKSIYNENIRLINTYADIYNFSNYNDTLLKVLNSTLAFNYIHRDIFAEWKKTNCDENKISNLYSASITIAKNKKFAEGNNELGKIKDCYKLYNSIKNLKVINIVPSFNKNTLSWQWYDIKSRTHWNSFSNYKESMADKIGELQIKNLYKTYLANSCQCYADKYFQNINEIKTQGYEQLGDTIIASFPLPDTSKAEVWENTEFFNNKKEQLEKVVIQFSKEYSYPKLNSHLKKYRNSPIFKPIDIL